MRTEQLKESREMFWNTGQSYRPSLENYSNLSFWKHDKEITCAVPIVARKKIYVAILVIGHTSLSLLQCSPISNSSRNCENAPAPSRSLRTNAPLFASLREITTSKTSNNSGGGHPCWKWLSHNYRLQTNYSFNATLMIFWFPFLFYFLQKTDVLPTRKLKQ